MTLRSLATGLLLAALLAPGARSQCAEPSDLDVDPASEPLRVEKTADGELRISWESVLADGYRLHRGSLGRLAAEGAYDHRVVAETADSEVLVDPPDGPLFFLVNSDCRAGDSGVGRDSGGVERPWGGLVLVSVGLQGGMGVNGVQFLLTHPAERTFTEDDWAVFAGPFADGAPGGPFGVPNANTPGEVRMAVIFGVFDPDPSFDPPPDMPVVVAEVLFGYHGAAPTAPDFEVLECALTDRFGNDIPETQCVLAGVDVLF